MRKVTARQRSLRSIARRGFVILPTGLSAPESERQSRVRSRARPASNRLSPTSKRPATTYVLSGKAGRSERRASNPWERRKRPARSRSRRRGRAPLQRRFGGLRGRFEQMASSSSACRARSWRFRARCSRSLCSSAPWIRHRLMVPRVALRGMRSTARPVLARAIHEKREVRTSWRPDASRRQRDRGTRRSLIRL